MVVGTVRRIRVGALVASLIVAMAAVLPTDRAEALGELTVSFFDVGQADATLLQHGDATILIDTGSFQRTDVVGYLDAAGVEQLDLLVVTHPHADHIGQFDVIMDAVDVDEVWWSGSTTTTQTFGRALDVLEASDAAYEEPRVGDTASVGSMDVEIVNPSVGVDVGNIHDASLALRITFGDTRWLFTGDAEAAAEDRMVAQSSTMLDADVYQVGHHGSSTSTTEAFLSAVDPAVAVYSAGANNQFGHPHDEVIDRLDASGVQVFGTDVNGTVTGTTDGTTITITPQIGTPYSFTVDGSDPGTPSAFPDIAGNTHEAAIVAIVEAGITTGFADGTFRPGDNVSRGQMATFLYRGFDLDEWVAPDPIPPPSDPDPTCVDINLADSDLLQEIVHIGPQRAQDIIAGRPWSSVESLDAISGIGPARLQDILDQGLASIGCGASASLAQNGDLPFSDVANTTHETGILAVAQADITGGFPDGTFRPGDDVTRGQMAAFISRTLELPDGTSEFPDVQGTTHEAAIGAVAAAGIAGGFGDGAFGPAQPVTRGQMATFLARALELI